MLFLKRGLMAAGALALAAMLLNFVAPKAAHAIVATAVQVMNTSATPVMIRDVDAAGRNAYILECVAASANNCQVDPIPAGYTFVLESYSVYVSVASGAPPTYAQVQLMTGNMGHPPQYGMAILMIPLTQVGGGLAVASGPLPAYWVGSTALIVGPTVQYICGFFMGHLVSTP